MDWIDEYIYSHVMFDIIEGYIAEEVLKEGVIRDTTERAIIPNEITMYVLKEWLYELDREIQTNKLR